MVRLYLVITVDRGKHLHHKLIIYSSKRFGGACCHGMCIPTLSFKTLNATKTNGFLHGSGLTRSFNNSASAQKVLLTTENPAFPIQLLRRYHGVIPLSKMPHDPCGNNTCAVSGEIQCNHQPDDGYAGGTVCIHNSSYMMSCVTNTWNHSATGLWSTKSFKFRQPN